VFQVIDKINKAEQSHNRTHKGTQDNICSSTQET